MLAIINATQIGRISGRLAAVLAGSQLTVAAAKVGNHSATLAEHCGADSAVHTAVTLGQTAWSMLDACVIGQAVHVAGALLASDSSWSAAQAVVGIIGHAVTAHLASIVFQILS
jgi:hypothetical protein